MRRRLVLLGFGFLIVVCLLVLAQARALVDLPRDPGFVRFMRRYDRRDNAAERLPDAGRAVDRAGRPLDVANPGSTFQHVLDDLALAVDGRAVRLSLDADLQAAAERAMAGRVGAVVAIEPASGRIRVLVSAPRAAWPNRALHGLYPPGSTFKIWLAGTALSAHLDPVYDCPAGGYAQSRGTPPIRDVEEVAAARTGRRWAGFGRLDMAAALAHSSNVYFAQLGVAMGPEIFAAGVARSRLRDAVTVLAARSVSLEAAECGIPDGLTAPQLAPVGIGQGALQMTPLAVAMLTSAVANDGVLLQPTLSESARPRLWARPYAFAAALRVKRMMREVVRHGTARACELPGLELCAKTGTAQTGKGRDHAWFTCFAPMREPRLVVTALVEHGGFGAVAAWPVAKSVLLEAQRRGYFP
ncbi:MAG: penicillin-binding transpeptidase domain-containing protein [Kiritimatiellia bacterium]